MAKLTWSVRAWGRAKQPWLFSRALSGQVPRDPCREKFAFSPTEVVLEFFCMLLCVFFSEGDVVTRTIFVAIETETRKWLPLNRDHRGKKQNQEVISKAKNSC